MAKYRPIYTKIWDDPDIQDYTPEEKIVFIYLCTNPLTTESGIYPISCKTISNDTGIELQKVEGILHDNRMKNVLYDTENKVVFIRNFLRYNGKGRKDLLLKSVCKDYIHTKTPLWEDFKKHNAQYFERVLSVRKQLNKTSIPIPISKPNLNSNPSPNHNSSHTSYVSNGQSGAADDEDNVPVDDMVDIFVKHWGKYNDGSYLRNPDKERKAAKVLWKQCKIDKPEAPLELFERRVEDLILDFDIKHFTGLVPYWNASADRDWLEFCKKIKK